MSGITKVVRINPKLVNISLKTTNVNLMVVLQENPLDHQIQWTPVDLVGTGTDLFYFFNQSEKYIILKKDRIHPCVRLSRVQES